MASTSSGTLVNTLQRMRSSVMMPKMRSTRLSHEAEVGVKRMLEPRILRQRRRAPGVLLDGVVVCNQMHIEVPWRLGIDPAPEP